MGPRVCAGVSGERTQVIQMTQVVSPKFRVPAHATNTAAASTCRDSIIFPRTLLRVRGDDEVWIIVPATWLCPRFFISFAPPQTEGAGKTGCALHPRSHVQCASKEA